MNTKHFDYIQTIAETGNLSAASRQLGISQPVLSRYLSRLEQQLGTPVFVQKEHRYVLTDAGQIYLNGVQRIKHLQASMYQVLEHAQAVQKSQLSIGIPLYFDGEEWADIYARLLSGFPNLELNLMEGTFQTMQKALKHKNVDVIDLLYHPRWLPDTRQAACSCTEVLLALPADHPFVKKENMDCSCPPIITIQELQAIRQQAFILADPSNCMGLLSGELLQRYQLEWNISLRTSNPHLLLSLLKTGIYGSFVLQNTASELKQMGFFRLPNPEYLYHGLVFRTDHDISSEELALLQAEVLYFQHTTPAYAYQNSFTRHLLGLKE